MTIAVDLGRKATKQTNKQTNLHRPVSSVCLESGKESCARGSSSTTDKVFFIILFFVDEGVKGSHVRPILV